MIGEQFGRLFIVRAGTPHVSRSGRTERRWRCLCRCGGVASVFETNLRARRTLSCGCLRKERAAETKTTHGATRGAKGWTAEYRSWAKLIERCTNANNKDWHNYGGRGISVDPTWRFNFSAFLAHVGAKPSALHSIDRINNNGHYEPGNVRWATAREQRLNQRSRADIKACAAEQTGGDK